MPLILWRITLVSPVGLSCTYSGTLAGAWPDGWAPLLAPAPSCSPGCSPSPLPGAPVVAWPRPCEVGGPLPCTLAVSLTRRLPCGSPGRALSLPCGLPVGEVLTSGAAASPVLAATSVGAAVAVGAGAVVDGLAGAGVLSAGDNATGAGWLIRVSDCSLAISSVALDAGVTLGAVGAVCGIAASGCSAISTGAGACSFGSCLGAFGAGAFSVVCRLTCGAACAGSGTACNSGAGGAAGRSTCMGCAMAGATVFGARRSSATLGGATTG